MLVWFLGFHQKGLDVPRREGQSNASRGFIPAQSPLKRVVSFSTTFMNPHLPVGSISQTLNDINRTLANIHQLRRKVSPEEQSQTNNHIVFYIRCESDHSIVYAYNRWILFLAWNDGGKPAPTSWTPLILRPVLPNYFSDLYKYLSIFWHCLWAQRRRRYQTEPYQGFFNGLLRVTGRACVNLFIVVRLMDEFVHNSWWEKLVWFVVFTIFGEPIPQPPTLIDNQLELQNGVLPDTVAKALYQGQQTIAVPLLLGHAIFGVILDVGQVWEKGW